MSFDARITNLRVLPSFSSGSFVLQWELVGANAAECAVNLFRAVGGEEYQMVSTSPLRSGMFVDQFRPKTKLDEVSWRMVIEHLPSGEMQHALQTGVFEALNMARHMKGRQMAAQQLHVIRRSGGRPCWILPGPGTNDPQVLLDACARAAAGGPDFPGADLAQKWQSWVLLGGPVRTETRLPDGTAKESSEEVQARLPAYPMPRLGTLVVLPDSDTRFVVGEQVTPFLFASVIPVAYDVRLSLLARTDARYNIQLPELDRDMARPTLLPLA
jgi:hypothetical protein